MKTPKTEFVNSNLLDGPGLNKFGKFKAEAMRTAKGADGNLILKFDPCRVTGSASEALREWLVPESWEDDIVDKNQGNISVQQRRHR